MSSSWAFEQAEKVLERVRRKGKDHATFECGFGPSGLPHIGTVAEMLRTRMVIQAFNAITSGVNPNEHKESYYQTQWILVADDLDALRKVPDTIPADKVEMMTSYLGTSVCKIPDPWGTHSSYAEHNISELVRLLELAGVQPHEYELHRSSFNYRNGRYNGTLTRLAEHVDAISAIVTHDYSEERKATYFPFLPIIDGLVVQDIYNPEMLGLAVTPHFDWYSAPGLVNQTTPNTTLLHDGNVKCQWKLDWPMRWMHFDVDFEMHGKDLIGSATVGRRICQLMQHEPPVIFMYELFLDENKQKISKSKGNGLEADEWLTYGSVESLQYFLWQNPVRGRILHWSCIPQYEDMYAKALMDVDGPVEVGSPLWHIHGSILPEPPPVTYAMLLNLVGIADTEDTEILWAYLHAYKPGITNNTHPKLQHMFEGAIRYYQKFVLPTKVYRDSTEDEKEVLKDILKVLAFVESGIPTDLRAELYEVGKAHYTPARLNEYFRMLYQVLLGQNSGPQFDQFIQIIGIEQAVGLIRSRI